MQPHVIYKIQAHAGHRPDEAATWTATWTLTYEEAIQRVFELTAETNTFMAWRDAWMKANPLPRNTSGGALGGIGDDVIAVTYRRLYDQWDAKRIAAFIVYCADMVDPWPVFFDDAFFDPPKYYIEEIADDFSHRKQRFQEIVAQLTTHDGRAAAITLALQHTNEKKHAAKTP